jgi:hypothetical protein
MVNERLEPMARARGAESDPESLKPGRSRIIGRTGEVDEWFKSHAWKACVRFKAYRGFESRSLRQNKTC